MIKSEACLRNLQRFAKQYLLEENQKICYLVCIVIMS